MTRTAMSRSLPEQPDCLSTVLTSPLRTRAAFLATHLFLLAPFSQGQDAVDGDVVFPADRELASDVRTSVLERDREWIHPGDQLRIVGLEQGDNEFRSRTPALLKGNLETAQIAPESLYAHKLALYASDEAIDRSPRSQVHRRDLEESLEDRLVKALESGEKEPFPWTLPVGLGALALVALRSRMTGR